MIHSGRSALNFAAMGATDNLLDPDTNIDPSVSIKLYIVLELIKPRRKTLKELYHWSKLKSNRKRKNDEFCSSPSSSSMKFQNMGQRCIKA